MAENQEGISMGTIRTVRVLNNDLRFYRDIIPLDSGIPGWLIRNAGKQVAVKEMDDTGSKVRPILGYPAGYPDLPSDVFETVPLVKVNEES